MQNRSCRLLNLPLAKCTSLPRLKGGNIVLYSTRCPINDDDCEHNECEYKNLETNVMLINYYSHAIPNHLVSFVRGTRYKVRL